jgi:hypothetical protein
LSAQDHTRVEPLHAPGRITPAAMPATVLVIGLVNEPSGNGTWVWDLLDRIEPQLRELIDLTDPGIPMPQLRRATSRHHRMADALPKHERVVLVTAAEPDEPRAGITRWHCSPGRLRAVRQTSPATPASGPAVDPFLLEDEIAQGGLDLVRVPPCRTASGPRTSSRVVASALLGILWDIVREARHEETGDRAAA